MAEKARIVYDVRNRRVVDDAPLGLAGFMSWNRLAQNLKASREIQPDEELLYIKANEQGIELVVRRVTA